MFFQNHQWYRKFRKFNFKIKGGAMAFPSPHPPPATPIVTYIPYACHKIYGMKIPLGTWKGVGAFLPTVTIKNEVMSLGVYAL